MQHVAAFNPINWAAQAGRAALSAHPDWGNVFVRIGWLAALTLLSALFAMRAFRAYQRSV
jgi:ABC-2 type transport system permease protein